MGNKHFYVPLIALFLYAQAALTSDAVTRKNDIIRILSQWQNTAKELNKKRESIVAMFKEKKLDRATAQQGINRIKAKLEEERNTAQNIMSLLVGQSSSVDLSTIAIETANIEDLAKKLVLD